MKMKVGLVTSKYKFCPIQSNKREQLLDKHGTYPSTPFAYCTYSRESKRTHAKMPNSAHLQFAILLTELLAWRALSYVAKTRHAVRNSY